MLAPPGELAPHPRGNPGSATDLFKINVSHFTNSHERRREEERKRYEDIDIPDDAEWKTIDVGAHHREIMEQHQRYEGRLN